MYRYGGIQAGLFFFSFIPHYKFVNILSIQNCWIQQVQNNKLYYINKQYTLIEHNQLYCPIILPDQNARILMLSETLPNVGFSKLIKRYNKTFTDAPSTLPFIMRKQFTELFATSGLPGKIQNILNFGGNSTGYWLATSAF